MNNIQFRKNYSAWIGAHYPIQQAEKTSIAQNSSSTNTKSFSEILQNVQQGGITFSKHALQRMDARKIEISPELMMRMNTAVEQAKAKGVRDALMMSGNTAFIVNIPSATVVTMMNGGEMKENIFTNIDGAVIL
ncbi:MAG: Flagellar operon protein [Oscillospiraceae bacterium]